MNVDGASRYIQNGNNRGYRFAFICVMAVGKDCQE